MQLPEPDRQQHVGLPADLEIGDAHQQLVRLHAGLR